MTREPEDLYRLAARYARRHDVSLSKALKIVRRTPVIPAFYVTMKVMSYTKFIGKLRRQCAERANVTMRHKQRAWAL